MALAVGLAVMSVLVPYGPTLWWAVAYVEERKNLGWVGGGPLIAAGGTRLHGPQAKALQLASGSRPHDALRLVCRVKPCEVRSKNPHLSA